MLFAKTRLMTMDLEALNSRIEQRLRDHRDKYIFQGVFFILCGVLTAALPVVTTINIALLVGAVLTATGILQFILTLAAKTHWWSLLSAGLSILVGLLIVTHPLNFLMAVITLIAIFLTIEGVFELLLAFHFRVVRNWGWMFFSSITTLGLAALLWIGIPTVGILYLAWVIAINFVLYGISLITLVWKVGRPVKNDEPHPLPTN